MNIVWGGPSNPDINEALGNWCAAQIGLPRPFDMPYSTMGVFQGETLIAVMLYNNWQPEAGVIEIHGAATDKRWLNKKSLWEMFSFPFLRVGAQLVVMRVSERNVTWNGRGLPRLLKSYGFKSYGIPRLRGRNEAEIIHTLTDDDWAGNGFHKENTSGKICPEAD